MPHLSPYEVELALLDNLTGAPKGHFNHCQRCMMAVCTLAMENAEKAHETLKIANGILDDVYADFKEGRRKRRFWAVIFVLSNIATFVNAFTHGFPVWALFISNTILSGCFGRNFAHFFTLRDRLIKRIKISDRYHDVFVDKRTTAKALLATYDAYTCEADRRQRL